MQEKIFTWQKLQWERFWQLRQQKRLPHALLFSGISGIGKKHFATCLAHSLLCVTPDVDGQACGECRGCRLTQSKSHPDLMMIEPEEVGQAIKIDRVREVVDFVNGTAMQSGYRVIVIHPASAMNTNAANALLKTLEEPTANVLFILVSDQSARLPATILSRCQKIIFQKPAQSIALEWLQANVTTQNDLNLLLSLADGAPLKAQQLLETDFSERRSNLYQNLFSLALRKSDPLQVAAQWQEAELILIFNLMQTWLTDLLRYKLTQGKSKLINYDFQEIFSQLIHKMSVKNLVKYIESMQKTYVNVVESINLNRQLLLEELFIQWVKHVSC